MMRRNVLAGPNEIYVVVRQVLTMRVPTTTTYDGCRLEHRQIGRAFMCYESDKIL